MRRSIRWRLQAWNALILVSVVTGFAGILYYQVRSARFREVDAGLTADALYLDASLRRFPPHELGGPPPDGSPPPPRRPEPRPPERLGPPPGGPPPRPSRQRLLADLALPRHVQGPEVARPEQAYFGVWRSDGSLLKADHLPEGVSGPDGGTMPAVPRVVQRGDARETAVRGPGNTRILVGQSVAREQADLRAFAWQLAAAGAAVLALGLAGGWLISAGILRPLAAVAATASAISETNLSERIDADRVDRELAELARVLNAMFARLEAAFERQARFTADASHELRTPLAILRSHTELALSRPRTVEEYRETLETCLRASGRMTGLVEGLLTLARADAGKLDLQRQPVDLRQVVEEGVRLFRPLAEEKSVVLTTSLASAEVAGDAARLGQVMTNLLSNAVQYNRPGGAVHVELSVASGEAVLSVSDTGCGIPAEDRPHLFERFYRVDKARARASGGNGLGLAICKSIVEAHGGTIGFETRPGEGSSFRVRLPASPGAAQT